MWHKSDGDGVLEGAGARLLKVAIAAWVEELRGLGCWDDISADQGQVDDARAHWLDVPHVARMEHGQRLHAIAAVVRALLDRGAAAPDLTADNEATVYQVYRFLCHATNIEHDALNGAYNNPVDDDEPAFVSTRIAIACAAKEMCGCDDDCDMCDPDMDGPRVDGPLEVWHSLVEELADTVLWDRDWEMESSLADSNPDNAHAVKRLAGIDGGYFTTPVDEPSSGQVARAKAYLESIADEILEDASTGV